jgi:hypothetical protein
MALRLLEIINMNNGLKLTEKGNLPKKTVLDIHALGYFKSDHDYLIKIQKEQDYFPLHICNILLKLSEITELRKGKIILTKKGTECINNHVKLFSEVLKMYCLKFNKAYLDRYESEEIGNIGAGFILYLISKFGNTSRELSFYTEKYIKAFPMLPDQIEPLGTISKSEIMASCLNNRLFWGYSFFGLIEIEKQSDSRINRNYLVRHTELFKSAIIEE